MVWRLPSRTVISDGDAPRDLAALVVPLTGSVQDTGDVFVPWRLADAAGAVVGDTEVVLQGPAALVPVPVGDLGAVGSGDPGRSAGLLPLASAGRQAGPPALAATRRGTGAAAGSGGGEPGDRQVLPGPQVCGIDGGALRDGDPHVL